MKCEQCIGLPCHDRQWLVLFPSVTIFCLQICRILVPEDSQNVVITIVRDRGTYGEVTVFLYSQSIEARKERDYVFEDQVQVIWIDWWSIDQFLLNLEEVFDTKNKMRSK